MTIVVCGATGQAGSRILQELLRRGHHVIAIARDPKNVLAADRLTVAAGDLSDATSIPGLIHGADAVVSAYAPPTAKTAELVTLTGRLVDAVARSGPPPACSSSVAPAVWRSRPALPSKTPATCLPSRYPLPVHTQLPSACSAPPPSIGPISRPPPSSNPANAPAIAARGSTILSPAIKAKAAFPWRTTPLL